ncbi:MAG: anthranilate synthase component I family protein [Pseudomonadota bacterium]
MCYHRISYAEFEDYAFKLAAHSMGIWFDSAMQHAEYGRYSFVTCDPIKRYYSDMQSDHKIFMQIEEDLKIFPKDKPPIPFGGGFAGYFSYDFGLTLLDIDASGEELIKTPFFCGGLYDVVLYADHIEKIAGFYATDIHPEYSAKERIMQFMALETEPEDQPCYIDMQPVSKSESYKDNIAKTREHIAKGDIFQANIARYYRAKRPDGFDPLSFYKSLRHYNPAPFGCFMNFPSFAIMSSSPERFLKSDGDIIETRPIKGTLSDKMPADILYNSEKDRAENIMIVDMLRNDLAKSSVTGSVKVPQLCEIESYRGLHHLVSVVTAEKPYDTHITYVLKHALPGGSVTGTPKKHACEIISQLEQVKRGAYCGTAGYIGYDGRTDMNILIRTVTCDAQHIAFGTGCGITYESDPEAELQEAALKAQNIFKSIYPI